ncbi:hypothetical protein DDZ13_07830 [Coraliomargarita sinensis]|uniref:Uncharacterized protein n=1 Tax=Coraliomargarita sinensis TaxID=2174842 RepID=A0A317ZM17_9BACT|nr:hypothetical protein DDZ13_07830 [Coraliomargarita sinensis]
MDNIPRTFNCTLSVLLQKILDHLLLLAVHLSQRKALNTDLPSSAASTGAKPTPEGNMVNCVFKALFSYFHKSLESHIDAKFEPLRIRASANAS